MIPETDEERIEREKLEAECSHEFETIEMPYEWEHLSGSVSCKKCTYSRPISVARVKEQE